jgi:[NiFe] hydrogenase diaphorase moiety small subunit
MTPTIEIDGRVVPFADGQSVMEAAEAAGMYIPHLCYDGRVAPGGNCRLCLVGIGGRLVPSCLTQAAEGQRVISQSDDLLDIRRALTRMLFVEGNHFCPSCEKSGDCRLQATAYELDVLGFDYPQLWPRRHGDASHPDVLLDRDRCIMCGLCVRASRELDGKGVFELGGRGADTKLMVNSPTGRLGDSDLEAGDESVAICPVGALLPKRQAFRVPVGQRRFDLHSISGKPR